MMKYIITAFIALFITIANGATESQPEQIKNETSSDTKTILQKADALKRDAIKRLGFDEKHGETRHVKKGANPEIVIKKSTIYFNGKAMNLGEPLAHWKKILGGKPFCSANKMTLCTWKEFGLQAGSAAGTPNIVSFMNLYLNVPEYAFENNSTLQEADDWRVKQPFTGYLELDGYGIDKATKFWELRVNADKERNLRCGLRECGFPHGGFGEDASLQLELSGASENNVINQLSVTR